MAERELNLDGLVGPTHCYAGLSFGNEASQGHAGQVSHPRIAALQGLQKMRLLSSLGIPQMVMPPHPRPDSKNMRALGFRGNLHSQVTKLIDQAPELLSTLYSSSGMWSANAATIAPGKDTADGRVHFTPANLISTAHRAAEPAFSSRVLKRLFADEKHFAHHTPLPANPLFADEGAANHMRLRAENAAAMHVFVYGRSGVGTKTQYPARQSLQASQSIARLHRLNPERTLFVQQTPEAIDAGVFHNDVIATSHENVLLYHEHAFTESDTVVKTLAEKMPGLCAVRVSASRVSMNEAVRSYLFNSQLVTGRDGMVLIAPSECEQSTVVHNFIRSMIADPGNPIATVHFVDLRESMQNGGGPACLRLRVALEEKEFAALHGPALFTSELENTLMRWVNTYYRERLAADDLRDPQLAVEAHAAYAELETILQLPGLYDGD